MDPKAPYWDPNGLDGVRADPGGLSDALAHDRFRAKTRRALSLALARAIACTSDRGP
jgi:hypothetical protein